MWYRLFALRDPFSPPPRNPNQQPSAGILQQQPLPYRPGPRPSVAGLAPQRQLNQAGSPQIFEALKSTLCQLSVQNPKKFVIATSCLEKHGFALFARHPLNVCGNGEVCHLHTSDKSMHMNLHPDDIKEILAKGWGQRHPMAWTGWVYTPVPSTFVMVYAPRGEPCFLVSCDCSPQSDHDAYGKQTTMISKSCARLSKLPSGTPQLRKSISKGYLNPRRRTTVLEPVNCDDGATLTGFYNGTIPYDSQPASTAAREDPSTCVQGQWRLPVSAASTETVLRFGIRRGLGRAALGLARYRYVWTGKG